MHLYLISLISVMENWPPQLRRARDPKSL
jgi:hypothetical protein